MVDQTAFKKESPAKTDAERKAGTIANRRTPRRGHDRIVGVLFSGQYTLVKSNQISEGGMMLELSHDLVAGDIILVTLLVPKTMAPILTRAEILYKIEDAQSKNPKLVKTGIRFIALEPIKKRLIRDYVSSKTIAEITEVLEHKAINQTKVDIYASSADVMGKVIELDKAHKVITKKAS